MLRLIALVVGLALAISARAEPPPPYDPAEARPGGAATADAAAPDAAFSRPVGNLPESQIAEFSRGLDLFYRRWVRGPAPPPALSGLGPLYNALSCQQCHLNDGRGRPPRRDGFSPGFALKLEPAHPTYGEQVQDRAVGDVRPDGGVGVEWRDVYRSLGDSGVAKLRRPEWRLVAPTHGDLGQSRLSGRIAPPVVGVGLIDAIDAAEIRAAADPDDRDVDGISGRLPPGRFGWRGEARDLVDQTTRAFSADMGIATAALPDPNGDCPRCPAVAARPEAEREVVDAIVAYVRNLGPPPRPNAGAPQVLRGRAVFHEIGCAQCHTPSQRTRPTASNPWLGGQTIWPYSNFLLHDLGPDLADGASAEWRTAPLWGLGRNTAVNGNGVFLHDGRARTPLEAALWHGGEAEASRSAMQALPREDLADLIEFLESL